MYKDHFNHRINILINVIAGKEEKFPIEARILNLVLFMSMIVTSISFISNLLIGLDREILIGGFLINGGFITLYILGRSRARHTILTYPFAIVQISAILYMWYYFDGISGSSNIYILAFVFMLTIIARGRDQLILIGGFLVVATVILFVELKHPEIVRDFPSEAFELWHTYLSTTFVAAGVLIMTLLILYNTRLNRKQLLEANKTKDKFFSIIAHDLKSPLASLASLGEFMVENDSDIDPETRKKMEEAIHESSKNTYLLLENLLNWARSESGAIVPEIKTVNLNDQVQKNISLLSEASQVKKLQVETEVPEDINVFADENMLNLVIRNLLSNAIKFSHKGRKITVKSDIPDNQKSIAIHFIDEGVGIEKEHLTNLFNLESTYRKKGTLNESGTGLGLKLCKEFIEKNGGGIEVHSMPDKGSDFIVTLPVAVN